MNSSDHIHDLDILLADLCNPIDVDKSLAARAVLDQFADSSWLPKLHELLGNAENFYIRESVATPIIRLEGLRALPQLLDTLKLGEDEGQHIDTLAFEISELIASNPEEAIPVLTEMLVDSDPQRRADAAWLMEFARQQ